MSRSHQTTSGRRSSRSARNSRRHRAAALLGGEQLEARLALAAAPQLVRDLSTADDGSFPMGFTSFRGATYFAAQDAESGFELWKTDGTAAGTVRVRDIWPGNIGSAPTDFTVVGSTLFFTASDPVGGRELWKTDGTAAGTVRVKDILPGVVSGYDFWPKDLTAVGNTLYFTAGRDLVLGRQLWKSDGTAAGTVPLTSFPNSTSGDDQGPRSLTAVGSTLYFSANDGVSGHELWKTNGTVAGTVRVKDINSGADGSSPYSFAVIGSTLYFSANDGRTFDDRFTGELWRSDGTEAGTFRVADLNGNLGAEIRDLTAVGSTLYFSAWDARGGELWTSDGTAAGTTFVKNIRPDGDNFGSSPSSFTAVGSTVLFTAADDPARGAPDQLWRTDGTEAGTFRVKSTGNISTSLTSFGPTAVGGPRVFFTVEDPATGAELWTSDGTEAGTFLLRDILPGNPHYNEGPKDFGVAGSTLYFSAEDGTTGRELWKTDGTPAGTVRVRDIYKGTEGSLLDDFTPAGRTLYFTKRDPLGDQELWKTDGSAAGTVRLRDDYQPDDSYSQIGDLAAVGQTLFFEARDLVHGNELWKSDGTVAGTVLLKDIRSGDKSGWAGGITPVGSTVFFTADDGFNGRELWKSDGTPAGTVMVKDINQDGELVLVTGILYTEPSNPSYLTNVNGTLFFTANNGALSQGEELWKSDGTAAGTVMVKDIKPGQRGSGPGRLTNVGGTLFFFADDGSGLALWKSDGTEAGTVRVKDLWPGAEGYLPQEEEMAAVGSTLYFIFDDGVTGKELWKSDGTEAGTGPVKDINPGPEKAVDGRLAVAGDTLYFMANATFNSSDLASYAQGFALWKSDGTAAGTVPLKELSPLVGNGWAWLAGNQWAVGSTLYFGNYDAATGFELWKTDGTQAGTVLVHDTWPGGSSFGQRVVGVAGPRLYFRGSSAAAGYELWSMTVKTPAPDFNGDGRTDIVSRDATTGRVVAEIRGSGGVLRETRVLGTEAISLPIFGSFETPVAPARTIVTHGLNAALGKWRVAEGDVQIIGSGYWQHSKGLQSLDLNGTTRGAIRQDITTTPGGVYDLSFRLAGNVDGGPAVKTVDVLWGPIGNQKLIRRLTFDTTGRSRTDMGWRTVSLPGLVAADATSRLSFVSRTAGSFGAVLDDVQLVPGGAANRSFVAAADFTGDGYSDVLWKRNDTGAHVLWVLNADGTTKSTSVLSADANLSLAATGDYDGDGRDDVVWRNKATGEHLLWKLDADGRPVSKNVVRGGSEWRVLPSGPEFDANRDGRTDLVWSSLATGAISLWTMNGHRSTSTVAVGNTATGTVVGGGDFNGDGYGDLLWRDNASGQVAQRLMRNGTTTSAAVIGGSLDDAIAWTGDFNGDRHTDVVWTKRSTGASSSWLLKGSVRIGTWAALGNDRWSIARRPGA